MSVSADLGADAYREGKGFVLVMIKREKRRWEKQTKRKGHKCGEDTK